ncbi:MAG: hypothetical protein JST22_17910 [Bacteroidetes bacterium]|nr:hypothetical protein [Bacteroidota bacterium]
MPDNSRPGETFSNPLPPNTPAAPYYVRTPIAIDIVNAVPALLAAWLAGEKPQPGARGDTLVTIPTQVTEGGAGGEAVSDANTRLFGSGTKDDPYTTSGVLYAAAPVTFAFVDTMPANLNLEAQGRLIVATSRHGLTRP